MATKVTTSSQTNKSDPSDYEDRRGHGNFRLNLYLTRVVTWKEFTRIWDAILSCMPKLQDLAFHKTRVLTCFVPVIV